MRQDVEIVSSRDRNFSIPRNLKPKTIFDVGFRTIFTTRDYLRKYPDSTIFSLQGDNANFLLDKNSLGYHDNVVFKYVDLHTLDLDEFIFDNAKYDKIDFMKLDVNGEEKRILKNGGYWANFVDYIKVRLFDYDYKEAKRDLRTLGFIPFAMHDGYDFYVIGENLNV